VLKVNTTVTSINLASNHIDNDGAWALIDALQVNTSLTSIVLGNNSAVDESIWASADALAARNKRLRCMFLFDARQMLLSVLCADECSVLWPYLLESGDKDGIVVPENLETVRAEFAVVVEERRRRELCRPVLVADFRSLQRETSNQIAEQSNRFSVLNDIVSGLASQNAEQTSQNAEQTIQIAEQTNQIADLQRSTGLIVEQNQQMQEQMRQMHALLMSRQQEQSTDVNERDERAAKRRRTGR
jgi:hypothetical protein